MIELEDDLKIQIINTLRKLSRYFDICAEQKEKEIQERKGEDSLILRSPEVRKQLKTMVLRELKLYMGEELSLDEPKTLEDLKHRFKLMRETVEAFEEQGIDMYELKCDIDKYFGLEIKKMRNYEKKPETWKVSYYRGGKFEETYYPATHISNVVKWFEETAGEDAYIVSIQVPDEKEFCDE